MTTDERQGHPLLRLETRAVGAGLLGGLLAGIAMGAVLQAGTDVLQVLGAFLGSPSTLAGWVVHVGFSLLFGVVFATLLAYPAVATYVADFGTLEHVLVGVTYGTLLAAVSIAVLPFVLELPWTGGAAGETSTNVPATGLGGLVPSAAFALAHVVYGGVLGAVYAAFADTTE